jgi:hypothetical protein
MYWETSRVAVSWSVYGVAVMMCVLSADPEMLGTCREVSAC